MRLPGENAPELSGNLFDDQRVRAIGVKINVNDIRGDMNQSIAGDANRLGTVD